MYKVVSSREDFKCGHEHAKIMDAIKCLKSSQRKKACSCLKCGHEWTANGAKKCRRRKCSGAGKEVSAELIIKFPSALKVVRSNDGEVWAELTKKDFHELAELVHGNTYVEDGS